MRARQQHVLVSGAAGSGTVTPESGTLWHICGRIKENRAGKRPTLDVNKCELADFAAWLHLAQNQTLRFKW
jgi:hypothetical protein